MGIEADGATRSEGFDGQDIPGLRGNDMGDEEIYFVFGVCGFSMGVNHVAMLGARAGGFDLHALESAAGVDDEVVGIAVSPGLGDVKAEFAGFTEKNGLGSFTEALAVLAFICGQRRGG